jgi:glycine betaine/proline transport system substrate-binding protein
MLQSLKRLMFAVLLGTVVAPMAQAAERSINIGWTAWSDAEAVTRLVKTILERRMGYQVKLTLADIALQYNGIARRDLDVMLMSWLPDTHADYLKRVGDDVVNLGVLYTGARLGWVVPEYVPRDQISSIEDLRKPAVRDKLRGRVQGIDPGAGLMRVSKNAVEAYGLDDYELVSASGAGMTAALARAVRRHRWIVVTGWSPHWMFGAWKLRYLNDPKGSLGGLERIHAIARKGFYRDHPDAAAMIARLWIPLGDLEAMMYAAQGTSYQDAVEAYIEANGKRIAYWVTGKL